MNNRYFSHAILLGCVVAMHPLQAAQPNALVLANRTLIWTPGIDNQLVTNFTTAGGRPVPALLKFKNSLSLSNHLFLNSAGVRLEEYLGGTSYLGLLPSATLLTNAVFTSLIEAAAEFLPADKIRVPSQTNQLAPWAYNPQKKELKVLVAFWRSIDRNVITQDLGSLGLSGEYYGANNSWALVAPLRIIPKLASLLSVKLIQEGPRPFFPLNDGGRRVANTDAAQQGVFGPGQPPRYNGLTGDGIRIAICDDGVDALYNDFRVITGWGTVGASRLYHTRTRSPAESADHGTHVASVAAGNGFNSASLSPGFLYRGHAPSSQIGDYPHFGARAADYYAAIAKDNTDVSNHSYVQREDGLYDQEASDLDETVRGTGTDVDGNLIPARPSVWGAGNNGREPPEFGPNLGYYSVFTSAKNTISVGSVDTYSIIDRTTARLSWFSSLGPTFDGRIKPDLVAPGCLYSIAPNGIKAARNTGQDYVPKSGTSIAAPVVSGIIALMMQEYKNTFSIAPDLNPSTYKAMLVHTAVDMVKTAPWPDSENEWKNFDTGAEVLYYSGPDFATGYGLVDGKEACRLMSQSSQWSEGTIKSTGDLQSWCIAVEPGCPELKVTIAWDDEHGNYQAAATAAQLVNDLDLELKAPAPDGTTHSPWTLDPLGVTGKPGDGSKDPIQPADIKKARQDVPDHVNNVEVATVANPVPGLWQATVKGFNLPFGNVQPFSVASSHPLSSPCMPEEGLRVVKESLCNRFPEICARKLDCQKLRIIQGRLVFPTRCPIALSEICKYVPHCPREQGPAWSPSQGFQMKMGGLPKDAVVVVFSDQGNLLAEDETLSDTRTLKVTQFVRGDRQFVFLTNKGHGPIEEELRLKFDFRPISASLR